MLVFLNVLSLLLFSWSPWCDGFSLSHLGFSVLCSWLAWLSSFNRTAFHQAQSSGVVQGVINLDLSFTLTIDFPCLAISISLSLQDHSSFLCKFLLLAAIFFIQHSFVSFNKHLLSNSFQFIYSAMHLKYRDEYDSLIHSINTYTNVPKTMCTIVSQIVSQRALNRIRAFLKKIVF
jgi:hypothetical protein